MPERPITLALPITPTDRLPGQPRACGSVSVSVKAGAARTVLDRLRMSGSLKCLFPRSEAPAPTAVLVNTAGGITGGDRFEIEAQAADGTALTLTTQAAERAYRAQPGEVGRLGTSLRVGRGAALHWLPQETILYDGSALHRSLQVDLAPGASLLLAEPLIFGRAAMGEVVRAARLRDRIEIRRDGTLLFLDQIALCGDIAAHLARPHVAAGAGAHALIVCIDADADRRLSGLRRLLPETAGASLIGSDVLVCRCLAADGFALRQTLIPALCHLAGADLPKCWML